MSFMTLNVIWSTRKEDYPWRQDSGEELALFLTRSLRVTMDLSHNSAEMSDLDPCPDH